MSIKAEINAALSLVDAAKGQLRWEGEGQYDSCFDVTALALETTAAAAEQAAALLGTDVTTIDRRLAQLWFHFSTRPIGDWKMPFAWDPIAGDYATKDGWIRLHTNAPHHREAALRVLQVAAQKETVAEAVADWEKTQLETAIVQENGCAAAMHTVDFWKRHPQGQAVAQEPLIGWQLREAQKPKDDIGLSGLKVLDLTRVLAGPVATRFLAGLGADVLRVDPEGWNEPAVELEVTLGKRCAGLDLSQPQDRARFETLLKEADVFVHGYRPGALAALGYGSDRIAALNPTLIEATLCAYGWQGPWAGRRGFDSLVQMSTGIAAKGMASYQVERPKPLPVQALDFATGYLLAAAILHAIRLRNTTGQVARARLSLARTADLLISAGEQTPVKSDLVPKGTDFAESAEVTQWGRVQRLLSPVQFDQDGLKWVCPAGPLRRDAPVWGASSG